MNSEFKPGTSGIKEKKQPMLFIILGITMLAAVGSVLSAFSIAFILFSAALYGWCTSVARHPVVTLAGPLAACLIAWLVTKDIDSLVNPLFVYLAGVVCGICIRKKQHIWRGAAFCGTAFGAMFLVSFYFLLSDAEAGYMQDGNILHAFSAWWNEMTSAFTEQFLQIMEKTGTETEITASMIEELFAQTAVLMPGVLAAFFVLLGGGAYLLSRIAHRVFATESLVFKEEEKQLHFGVSIHLAVFFLVSSVMAALCSVFRNAETVQFAFVNLCIGMFIPMLSNGIYMLIAKLKAPEVQLVAPDGRVMRAPSKTMILWIIIPLAVMNFLMGLLFIAFFGAVEEIKYALALALVEKSKRKNNGTQE